MKPEILSLERKYVRNLEKKSNRVGYHIHSTWNDTLFVSSTDSVSKGTFPARYTAQDDAVDPLFVTDLDFTLPIM